MGQMRGLALLCEAWDWTVLAGSSLGSFRVRGGWGVRSRLAE